MTKPVGNEQLKPCPMCGGSASFGLIRIGSPSPISNRDGVERTESHYTHCQMCQVNNNGIVHGYDTQEEAALAWNTRASAPVGNEQEPSLQDLAIQAAELLDRPPICSRGAEIGANYTIEDAEWDALLRMYQKTKDQLNALRQQVEDTVIVAQTDVDSEDTITAYHFKTGAIHRLIAKAREGSPLTEDHQTIEKFSSTQATPDARELSDELVDEVQRRADAVVDAAVAWATEEDEEFDRTEILSEAVDRLLQLRVSVQEKK